MTKGKLVKFSSFIILAYFSIILSLALVAAQTNNPILDPIVDLFTFKTDLSVSTNIAKYLFIILLSSLVWSSLDASGLVKNNGIRWLISIVVAFLGISYLGASDIWALLISYNALGLTLLFLFPFIILLFFTTMTIKEGKAMGIVTQHIIWMIYFVFLIYRFVAGAVEGSLPVDNISTWIFLAAIILSAFMVFGNRGIIKWFQKEIVNTEIDVAETTERRAAELTKARARALRDEANLN